MKATKTMKLCKGVEVLCREDDPGVPYICITGEEAEAKVAALGSGWAVYKGTGPELYVSRRKGVAKHEKLLTAKLHNGVEVLAVGGGKHLGEPRGWGGPTGLANAARNAKALGPEWGVYQVGDYFCVGRCDQVGKSTDGGAPRGAKYPKPDRSDFIPNFKKVPDNEILDLARNEGVLSDGRPFRVEYWCQDQLSMLTYFFSTKGMESASSADFIALLEKEGLLKFKSAENRIVEGKTFKDPSGNDMWTVSVVVGAGSDPSYLTDTFPLKRWGHPLVSK